MRLVYGASSRAVKPGDVIQMEGGAAQVHGFIMPTTPEDQGTVTLYNGRTLLDVAAGTIGAQWIEREDREGATLERLTHGTVAVVLKNAADADLIEIDGEHMVRNADILTDPHAITGDADEPVLFLSYREGSDTTKVNFNVGGLKAGRWTDDGFQCEDVEGTTVTMRFVKFISIKH